MNFATILNQSWKSLMKVLINNSSRIYIVKVLTGFKELTALMIILKTSKAKR